MKSKYYAPAFESDAFNCPYCGVYATQRWFDIGAHTKPSGSFYTSLKSLSIAICGKCNNYSLWHEGKMLYPIFSTAAMPSEDMPKEVADDFVEARNIVNSSPRSACAILRLALQKLMIHLGEKGKDLNGDIGNLVKKGLPEKIKKALDSVRVIGNNAVHPGELDLKDDQETANTMFDLINMIIEVMITQPKEVDKIFEKIPSGAKEAIKKRDAK
jgi:hypothetical protein